MRSPDNQSWNSQDYRDKAGFVADLGAEILGWLAPQEGEKILDLGCGDGRLTTKLAAAGADVLGLDESAELLMEASNSGLNVTQGDGQALSFNQAFDAVFSNAALHWMRKPDAVIAGVYRALRPGGRFVAEFGGFGNVAAVASTLRLLAKQRGLSPDLAAPWYFPHTKDYQSRLERAGFSVERIALAPRLTPLPRGMRGWLETFAVSLLSAEEGKHREAILDEAETALQASLQDEDGIWYADYVRIRVAARKGLAS